ncbi:hypothetical protein [Nonomuraea sp. NPDC049784]|uniref:hypothetical protein n=1 Tax=Nonomuraea sp. NPDC049784 TaxID=3154361 RepID=UPI0034063E62
MFTGGINLGPYEAAKHLTGVSARELSMIRNRHIDIRKLNAAIATSSRRTGLRRVLDFNGDHMSGLGRYLNL